MQATSPAQDAIIQLTGVSKWYGKFQVLDEVSLSVKKGNAW